MIVRLLIIGIPISQADPLVTDLGVVARELFLRLINELAAEHHLESSPMSRLRIPGTALARTSLDIRDGALPENIMLP